MPTFETPSDEELEPQTRLVQAALTTATTSIATAMAAKFAMNIATALMITPTIPVLWNTKFRAYVLRHIMVAYTNAAQNVLDIVNAHTMQPINFINANTIAQYSNEVQNRFMSLGIQMQQTALSTIAATLRANDQLSTIDITTITPTSRRLAQIAQNEVHTATQAGTLAQANIVAQHARITCTWRSRHDERTRPWHRAADGQVIAFDESFHVGNSWLLAPSIPAPGRTFDVGDLCNCRCKVRYDFDIITNVDSEMPRRGYL